MCQDFPHSEPVTSCSLFRIPGNELKPENTTSTAHTVCKMADKHSLTVVFNSEYEKVPFKWNLGVWRAKSHTERGKKRRLTCAMHSGPLLPLVWNYSELRRCPGSDQDGRSAEVHAACRWSSGWSHQSAEQSHRVHNGKLKVSRAIRFNW